MNRLSHGLDGLAISGEYIWDKLPGLDRTRTTTWRPCRRAQSLCVYYPWVTGAILYPVGGSEIHGLRLPLVHLGLTNRCYILIVVFVPKKTGSGLHGRAVLYAHGLHSPRRRGTTLALWSRFLTFVCTWEKHWRLGLGGGDGLVPWAAMCVAQERGLRKEIQSYRIIKLPKRRQ